MIEMQCSEEEKSRKTLEYKGLRKSSEHLAGGEHTDNTERKGFNFASKLDKFTRDSMTLCACHRCWLNKFPRFP